jgi:putative redox protein
MTPKETPTPSKKVHLKWTGNGMEYLGTGAVGPAVIIDGKSEKGPGPMDSLLLALAGCMAVDVQVILERSRVPLRKLDVEVEGERAQTHPKRYTRIRLAYHVEGPQEEHEGKLDRAVTLSKEKFCSVLHSLSQDIEFEFEINRV